MMKMKILDQNGMVEFIESLLDKEKNKWLMGATHLRADIKQDRLDQYKHGQAYPLIQYRPLDEHGEDKEVLVRYEIKIVSENEFHVKKIDNGGYILSSHPFPDTWMTATEADERWGLANGTIRAALNRRFESQKHRGIVRKSGSVWLISEQAMKEVYGDPVE